MPARDALARLDQAATRWENAQKTIRANAAKVAAHAARRLRSGDAVEVGGVRYLVAEVTWPVEISDDSGRTIKGKDAEAVENADPTPRRAKALLRLAGDRSAWAALHDPRKTTAPEGFRYRPSGEALTIVSGQVPAEAVMAGQADFIAFSQEMDEVLDAFVAQLEHEQTQLAALGEMLGADSPAPAG
jgi:hypothetical protein